MTDNEFTRFDPTPEETEALLRIHGAYDNATALRQLREYPLEPTYQRYYTDHTGRFFEDVSPEESEAARNDPMLKELNKIISEEITREILREIGFKP